MNKEKTRLDIPYMLYLDRQTKDRLEAMALKDRRSQAEMIRILIDQEHERQFEKVQNVS